MNIPSLIEQQRAYFNTKETRPISFRIAQLKKLKEKIEKHEDEILTALQSDLHKSEFESYTTEIAFLYAEISMMVKELEGWMKPEKVKTPVSHIGSKSYIYKEPYGVSLVIAPWNYPFQLALAPVLGAIAAGNTVILKPSELTPHVSSLLREIINETFEQSYFTVVEGAVEVSQELLEQKFDIIFFTGSVPVGKIVMEKAAKQLTPVVLELGGKSPVIVDETAKLDLAAKRIAWGKFINAGQTCIAPDYLYVHRDVKPELLSKLKDAIQELYGSKALDNEEYTHIVNQKHFDRLFPYLENGELLYGGSTNRDQLVMEPTILDHITWDDPVMQEEIFGPILPVLTFDSLDEVVEKVRSKEKPLALYYFTEDEQRENTILEQIPFGGGCVNDTILHVANPHLPFGGVGPSGTGSYHGKASFDAFSHRKSIVHQTTKFDFSFRYPGSKFGLSIIKRLLK
ncbi:aldehyde dehydrogenase [Pontibacillus salicampi]|uniref:Aldehyde dehydrogenase n=1 Tax=Pontibacillus salicampi TaxID=1449801 RepID=A0ABV6LKN5_9BACI